MPTLTPTRLLKLYLGVPFEAGDALPARVAAQVSQCVDSFTLIEGLDVWYGKGERSLIIEIQTSSPSRVMGLLTDFVEQYKKDCNQKSVMWTDFAIKAGFE